MTQVLEATLPPHAGTGRPTVRLPNRELIRISLYWLGLSSIFAGLNTIMTGRLEFTGLVDKHDAGQALFFISISGAIIAVIVQPTIGSISDYTISRWGRRKPYILIGSILDLVFLIGIASSNTLVSIAAFIALLQFSSNFARGRSRATSRISSRPPRSAPPAPSSASCRCSATSPASSSGARAVATQRPFRTGTRGARRPRTGHDAVGRRPGPRGPPAKSRGGRSWRAIAAEAVGHRHPPGAEFPVARRLAPGHPDGRWHPDQSRDRPTRVCPMGLGEHEAGLVLIPLVGLVALGTVVSVVPSARISIASAASPSSGRAARSAPWGWPWSRARRACPWPTSERCSTGSRPGSSWRSTGRS